MDKPRIKILQREHIGPFFRVTYIEGLRKLSDGYHHTHSLGVKMRHGSENWPLYAAQQQKAFQIVYAGMARAG